MRGCLKGLLIGVSLIIMVIAVALKLTDDSPYAIVDDPHYKFTEMSRFGTSNELGGYLKSQLDIGQNNIKDVQSFMADHGNPECILDDHPSKFDTRLTCWVKAPKDRYGSSAYDWLNRWMIENLSLWFYRMDFEFSQQVLVDIQTRKDVIAL